MWVPVCSNWCVSSFPLRFPSNWCVSSFPLVSCIGILARREQAHPARRHVSLRPVRLPARVELDDDVQMVAHHRIGVDGDRKALAQPPQALLDPGLAMLEGLARVVILPAQEGAADAALDAVVASSGTGGDQGAAGGDHTLILRRRPWRGCRNDLNRG